MMEFRGSHYAYRRGSEESVYGQNLIMDQTGHHRQPSYLAAIDITRPTDVEPKQEFAPFCSFGVSKGTGDQKVAEVENCGGSAGHYNQITRCREKLPSSVAENLSAAETGIRYGSVKGRIGGFKGVGDLSRVSQMHSQMHVVAHHNDELHLNYFDSMKTGNMGHRPRHDVMTLPSQNVKNIPRAVVAPITRHSANYNYSESDRFSSLPKTVKLVGSKSDKNSIEAVHPSNYSELFSFESDNAKKIATCNAVHSKVWSDMNHPVHAKPRQRNQERLAELSSYDGSDNNFDYIRPQKVEQVLSLQKSRKLSSSRCRRNSTSDVTGQISVSTVAAVMPDCHSINAQKVAAGSCYQMIDRLSNVSLAVPCYTAHEVDRISTSSSSTKRSSVNSHCDSGYSGSRHSDSLKSSCSQSPELYTSLAYRHHVPSSTREHFIREQNPAAGLTIARSVSYQGDSVRHPKYAESVEPPFCWEESNSNAHSSERNQTVNISDTMSKTNDKHKTMANEMKSRQSYHNKNEDMKYLQMLNKQIKLYREKESGENVKNYCHPIVENIPDVQTRRERVFSSCGSIEKCLPDSKLAAMNSKVVKFHGSADFSNHALHYHNVDNRMDHLISRKKTLKLNQIGRGVGDKIYYNPGTLKLKNVIARNDLQASDHSSSGKTVNNLEAWSENSSTCGSCGDESSLLLSNRKDTIGNPCSFMWENSAEDIISAWTSMKGGKIDENSKVPVVQHMSVQIADNSQDISNLGKHVKKSVSFSDSIALIASAEEVLPQQKIDYVEYATSFLRERANKLQSYKMAEDQNSNAETSSHGSFSSESRSESSISLPESPECVINQERDSDFYENELSSECSENDSEGTTVDESGKIRCSLCQKRWIDISEVYCRDCHFYMSKFQ